MPRPLFITVRGRFIAQRREHDFYEVYFKDYRTGILFAIVEGLTRQDAYDYSDALNRTLPIIERNQPRTHHHSQETPAQA